MQFPFLSFMSRRPYKVGVAFSGGGARGFAHVGAIEALADYGIVPDVVAGVSAGSIVASFYAAGLSPAQMMDAFKDLGFRDFCELSVPKDGFFKLTGFKKFLHHHIGYRNIEDLPVPLVICATNIDKCRPKAWDSGEIVPRVTASCSMPIIFKPVKIDGVTYVDGGVLHNLPAWAIRDKCKYLIGVNCSPLPRGAYKHNLIDIAHRTYNMMAKTNAEADMKQCDLAVNIDRIAKYQVFDLKDVKKVYQIGYRTMAEALEANGFRRIESKTKNG